MHVGENARSCPPILPSVANLPLTPFSVVLIMDQDSLATGDLVGHSEICFGGDVMKSRLLSFKSVILAGGAALIIIAVPGAASAQVVGASPFCPVVGGPASGTVFIDGTCATAGQGAVSTAALSSQALTEATQNVSQVTNDQTVSVVRRRLDQERPATAAVAPAAAPRPAVAARPAARRAAAPARDLKDPMIVKAEPVVQYGPTYAFWAHGFGDWERWKADFGATRFFGLDPTTVNMTRTATTFGGLGGVDVTFQGEHGVYVFGLLGGYMESDVKFASTSVGVSPDNSTISNVKATISGPSVGGYITFATGAFSADVTARVDFLNISETFNEILFVNANPVNNAGTLGTDVVNYNLIGNLNYRVPVSAVSWWEPTVGIRTTVSDYNSNAAALGLADGSVVRLQGGLRFGTTWQGWYGTTVVTTLTGLAYSNVLVSGYTLDQSAGFGTGTALAVTPNDEGEIRGQGILTMNFIHSPFASTFIQAEVRGGDDYYGYGGKVGFRLGWN
jgi:hypothetical protein